MLEIANLGDSGARVLRGGAIIAATRALQHQFNMPYQLGNATLLPETDLPSAAEVTRTPVAAGDVLVMATDGFFDNVWDDDMAGIVARSACDDAEALARDLAQHAELKSRDKTYRSPFSVEAAQHRPNLLRKMFPQGGKMDDVTVVVAFMTAD